MKAKKINLTFIILMMVIVSQLFTGCGTISAQPRRHHNPARDIVALGVGVGIGVAIAKNQPRQGRRNFNPYSRFTPRMWNAFCEEFYHFDNDCTLQRTSPTSWRRYTRSSSGLIKSADYADFNLGEALYRNGYDIYDELEIAYFHPVFSKGMIGYWVQLSNGNRLAADLIIFSDGSEMEGRPVVIYQSPIKFFPGTEESYANH